MNPLDVFKLSGRSAAHTVGTSPSREAAVVVSDALGQGGFAGGRSWPDVLSYS